MQLKNMLLWALRRGQTKAFIKRAAETAFGCGEKFRLDKFNAVWKDAYENVPFYAEWKEKHQLPNAISSLKELSDWPVLEKKDLVLNADKLIRPNYKGSFHESVTGGATGEPLHFRTWPGESEVVSVSKWLGWAQYGIYPDTRCFLLWGHRHFYGQGFRSNLKFAIRRIKDWMTNNYRADATDLSKEALEKDIKALLKFKPEAIIAYSASLLALCKSFPEYSEKCRALNIKAVICTAGPLAQNERALIGEYFGCDVGMEYGSMEGGVYAYTSPSFNGRYGVFKQTHIIHSEGMVSDEGERILVTAIFARYLPLIRYSIGDYMRGSEKSKFGDVIGFKEVTGRTGDLVDLGNGICFHGYSFMVCAEENRKIIAYQLKINRTARRVIFVAQVTFDLTNEEKIKIRSHGALVAKIPEDMIEVECATELIKAPSGKIRLVVYED